MRTTTAEEIRWSEMYRQQYERFEKSLDELARERDQWQRVALQLSKVCKELSEKALVMDVEAIKKANAHLPGQSLST